MSARRPGRNQTCPCGSGKKWKHCHGSPVSPEASKLPTSAVVPMMGVPGEVQNLVPRNVLAGKPDTATVQWRPGKYRVQLMLGRPGYPIDPEYTHGFVENFYTPWISCAGRFRDCLTSRIHEPFNRMRDALSLSPEPINVCVCSFSEDSDSLSQWRA